MKKNILKTKIIFLMTSFVFCIFASGCKNEKKDFTGMTAEEIVASLTLEQKASQMVMPACYNINDNEMKRFCYGSILSQGSHLDASGWRKFIARYQKAAIESKSGVPFIYGQDDVHGVNYCVGAVFFPHNIGLGAANDENLMYRIGQATADEAKLCHMLWNFAPCVAQSVDPRWGRTYESYGADIELIKKLSVSYSKGMLDSGLVVCPKHFFGDGNVTFGTGESSDQPRLIDRGDARLSDAEIKELLSVYQAQIDAGVQTIMISFSSLNGLKMHENKYYIDMLKNEMGFKGFIVSDWEAVSQTSPKNYPDQVAAVVNAGVDMLMEALNFREAKNAIIDAVESGKISEERVNDAVRRIIQVKIDSGIMSDPMYENLKTVQTKTGSKAYREIAEEAVEKSLVLLKNEKNILPLKSGMSVYIMGPAADNDVSQCGGWSVDWNQSSEENISGVTSILEGFKNKSNECGIKVITNKSEAKNADVVLLVVGEEAYAEWCGDTDNPDLCGPLGLTENGKAIEEAKKIGKPVVACIVAGRQVFISKYMNQWDAAVMCYLPGSEGQGVANVLCGKKPFTGKLPSPWYSSINQIESAEPWLPIGYGLTAE